jgi:hypothetical protein
MYAEFAFDAKVQRLSEAFQRRFVMLLCLRCANGDVTMCDGDVTFHLRISDEEWNETKRVLIEKNMIDADNNIVHYAARQYVSDSSTERTRKYRDNKKQRLKEEERHSDDCETSQRRSSDALEAEAEAEAEAEEKAKTEGIASGGGSSPPAHARTREPPPPPPNSFSDSDLQSDPINRRACEISELLRKRGASISAMNPTIREWAERGYTDGQLLSALEIAQERRQKKADPNPVNAGLINSIIPDVISQKNDRAKIFAGML